ncbi:hypothetical protein AURDEDRAFT_148440 [Auricularia subglabra TFB-10046 SS5]|nr:hypothetical protein AURDEDRAFT_148440 [Auricularia subglabra TFB-10046 SS5]
MLLATHDRISGTFIDYSPFLKACYDHRLPHLLLVGAGSIAPSIQEFIHATQGECSMVFMLDYGLRLECKEDGVTRELQTAGGLPFVREASSFVYFNRLHELSIFMGVLLGIYELQLPGSTFPALHSLTLVLQGEDIPLARHLLSANGPGAPLRMPRLHQLALETRNLDYSRKEQAHEHTQWLVGELPSLLPALIATGRPCLGALTVVMTWEKDISHFRGRQDLAALRGLAETFQIMDQSTFYHFDDDDE